MRLFGTIASLLPALLLTACASTASQLPAQQEANHQVVLQFYEAGLNRKDADAALKYVGERYVQHMRPMVRRASGSSSLFCATSIRTRTVKL